MDRVPGSRGENAPNASPPLQQMPAPPAMCTTMWLVTGRRIAPWSHHARCRRPDALGHRARVAPRAAPRRPGGHELTPGAGGERGRAPGVIVMAISEASTTHGVAGISMRVGQRRPVPLPCSGASPSTVAQRQRSCKSAASSVCTLPPLRRRKPSATMGRLAKRSSAQDLLMANRQLRQLDA